MRCHTSIHNPVTAPGFRTPNPCARRCSNVPASSLCHIRCSSPVARYAKTTQHTAKTQQTASSSSEQLDRGQSHCHASTSGCSYESRTASNGSNRRRRITRPGLSQQSSSTEGCTPAGSRFPFPATAQQDCPAVRHYALAPELQQTFGMAFASSARGRVDPARLETWLHDQLMHLHADSPALAAKPVRPAPASHEQAAGQAHEQHPSSQTAAAVQLARPAAQHAPPAGDSSREARLALQLVALPPGAPLDSVLGGQVFTGRQITRLLSCLDLAGARLLALRTFDWLEQREPHDTRDCFIYTRLMSMFLKDKGGTEQALQLFDRMKAAGVRPDLVAFNTAINTAGKARDWDRTTSLFMEMKALGVKPDVVTYSSLIGACQTCKRWDAAFDYYKEMEQAGVIPNVVTYTTLITVSNRAGRWQQAMKIFQMMEMAGISADVVACNSAITACAKGGAWEKAWAVFTGMKRMGVHPTTVTYNALISACERAGQPDRAMEAFSNMEKNAHLSIGVLPSAVTFNTLISACGKAGRYKEAMALYKQMQQQVHVEDVFTMTALITACEKVGRWEEALQIFQDFTSRGVHANTISYNSVIQACGSSGQWQQAVAVLRQMQHNPDVLPDVITYGSVIAACERCGEYQMALQMLDEMLAAGVQPNSYIFMPLINSCESKGDWQKAIELFNLMQELELELDSTAMVARRVLYAFPTLLKYMPAPLVAAARVAVNSGRAARRWITRT